MVARPPSRLLKKRKRLLTAFRKEKVSHSTIPEDASEDPSTIEPPTKRRKSGQTSTQMDNLPWKKVHHPLGIGFEPDGFMMTLEEIDGVEVRKTGDTVQYHFSVSNFPHGTDKISSL